MLKNTLYSSNINLAQKNNRQGAKNGIIMAKKGQQGRGEWAYLKLMDFSAKT